MGPSLKILADFFSVEGIVFGFRCGGRPDRRMIKQSGFTLMELLVVIAILEMLAAILFLTPSNSWTSGFPGNENSFKILFVALSPLSINSRFRYEIR